MDYKSYLIKLLEPNVTKTKAEQILGSTVYEKGEDTGDVSDWVIEDLGENITLIGLAQSNAVKKILTDMYAEMVINALFDNDSIEVAMPTEDKLYLNDIGLLSHVISQITDGVDLDKEDLIYLMSFIELGQ